MSQTVKRIILTLSVALLVAVALYVAWMIALAHAFGAFDPTYTKADLIRHYKAKAPQIWALSAHVNGLVPAHKSVMIEFDGSRNAPIFHVESNGVYSSNWDLPFDSPKADSLLQQLGWTRQTLRCRKSSTKSAVFRLLVGSLARSVTSAAAWASTPTSSLPSR